MSKILTICFLGVFVAMTGCVHGRYRVYVYNGTSEKINETKVTLSNGESLEFGTLGPLVDAGIWPVIGPLGVETLVEWMDAQETKKSAKAEITSGLRDDSVIFLINPDDTVTIQTGRNLYGPSRNFAD